MVFIFLTFLAAFLIEALGTVISVYGLSHLFGANMIIIALAVALDMGKLVVVSLTYSYWKKLNYVMRAYALVATIVTMTITSAGAAGYLAGEFQKAILGTQEGGIRVEMLKKEQVKLEERKRQIDDQLANVPEKYSASQRIRLINQFKEEQLQVTTRLTQIDKELPELQIAQIGTEAKAGPILFISKAFEVPVETAVKWIILCIIFVFDPLAVFLIIAGNFLLEQRKHQQQTEAKHSAKSLQQTVLDFAGSKFKSGKKRKAPESVEALAPQINNTHHETQVGEPSKPIIVKTEQTDAQQEVLSTGDTVTTDEPEGRIFDKLPQSANDDIILSIKEEVIEPIVENITIESDNEEPLQFIKKIKDTIPEHNNLKFREPDSSHESELIPLVSAREQITRETLGLVAVPKGSEVGLGTGAFRT